MIYDDNATKVCCLKMSREAIKLKTSMEENRWRNPGYVCYSSGITLNESLTWRHYAMYSDKKRSLELPDRHGHMNSLIPQ